MTERDSDNVTLRITVPRAAYAAMKIKAAGRPVAPFIAECALAWLNEEVSDPSDTSPEEQWAALGVWLRDNPAVRAAKPDTITTRPGLLAWAQERGFQKP